MQGIVARSSESKEHSNASQNPVVTVTSVVDLTLYVFASINSTRTSLKYIQTIGPPRRRPRLDQAPKQSRFQLLSHRKPQTTLYRRIPD
jgi:hypothetical protein